MNALVALQRSRRLQQGRCPDHDVTLKTKEPLVERGDTVGVIYACPHEDCRFEIPSRSGTRLNKLLR